MGHPASPILRRIGSDRGPRPPKGQSVKSGRGARSARPQRLPRRTRGDVDDHPIAPTKPLSASPHAVIQPGRPCGRGLAAACGPRVEGPDPVDNAGERRIPRGGSLQESKFQVWPAAIRPQTPAVPGTKRPPGFGRRSDAQRQLDISPDSHSPRTSRARPEGHSEHCTASGGRRKYRQTRSAAAADVLLRVWCRALRASHTPNPERETVEQGRCRGEEYSPLHILSGRTLTH